MNLVQRFLVLRWWLIFGCVAVVLSILRGDSLQATARKHLRSHFENQKKYKKLAGNPSYIDADCLAVVFSS